MPYIKTWEDPDEVVSRGGVVVHDYYRDRSDDDPVNGEYAIYRPSEVINGLPVFYDLEISEPCAIVRIADLRGRLGLDPLELQEAADYTILELAIDAGILTQAGIVAVGSYPWGEDKLSMALPLAELSVKVAG